MCSHAPAPAPLCSAPHHESSLFTLISGRAWLVQGSADDPLISRVREQQLQEQQRRELAAAAAVLREGGAGQPPTAAATSGDRDQPFWRGVRDAAAEEHRRRVQGGGPAGADAPLSEGSGDGEQRGGGVSATLVEELSSFR
jgi:hypothetical protein